MSTVEAKIFARLKNQLSKLGYSVVPSGPISFLAELGCMEWHLPTLEDVEEFFSEVKGACHDV